MRIAVGIVVADASDDVPPAIQLVLILAVLERVHDRVDHRVGEVHDHRNLEGGRVDLNRGAEPIRDVDERFRRVTDDVTGDHHHQGAQHVTTNFDLFQLLRVADIVADLAAATDLHVDPRVAHDQDGDRDSVGDDEQRHAERQLPLFRREDAPIVAASVLQAGGGQHERQLRHDRYRPRRNHHPKVNASRHTRSVEYREHDGDRTFDAERY